VGLDIIFICRQPCAGATNAGTGETGGGQDYSPSLAEGRGIPSVVFSDLGDSVGLTAGALIERKREGRGGKGSLQIGVVWNSPSTKMKPRQPPNS